MPKILKTGAKVIPSFRAIHCHPDKKTQYPALSFHNATHAGQLLKFYHYMSKEFIPHYETFKTNCETMQVKDALKHDPFMQEIFFMTADQFIAKMRIQSLADDVISLLAHGCTGSRIGTLSALDYLNCAQALVLELRLFSFDEDAMAEQLRDNNRKVIFDSVRSVRRNSNGTYLVETLSGATYNAKNIVLATPADVTVEIVKPVVKIPRIRNTSTLWTFLVRGRMKPRYQEAVVHIFGDTIPLIFTRKRSESEWEIFTEKEIDMGEYFDKYEIVESVYWPKALFTNPNIVLDQDLAENLYMAGDHNGLGMEPAAISGIYAANQILKRS
jgi:hypothetical protein